MAATPTGLSERVQAAFHSKPGQTEHAPGPAGRYINFNAFSAKLVASIFQPAMQLKVMVWSELSQLLEVVVLSAYQGGIQKLGTEEQMKELFCLDIKAAMQSILRAASTLRDASRQSERDHRCLPADRELWNASAPGFAVRRWNFWKSRLQSLLVLNFFNQETSITVRGGGGGGGGRLLKMQKTRMTALALQKRNGIHHRSLPHSTS
ncbi:hypothetical protein MPH_04770 [Macrophomina phaseolina MS6]|uniref:Uncharacterized protein n=1 Tax=Macrophomina phaseolina (strain MS6) TaxID=1126212 RepID=K2SMV0_MACPH|nr:hypothetical protein MPH_04770 [Macrophomina phaseolina MS6]